MSQSFKVFFLKKGKRCHGKFLPIYVRVTVDGKRAEWSVQRSCEPGSKWNQTAGRAIGIKEDVKILNAYLDAIQGNIFAIQKEHALRSEPITAEKVRSKILCKDEEKQLSLIEVYKYHNDQFEKLIGLEYSKGTFKKFRSALKSLENFIIWKFNEKDVYLSAVNHKFITDYEFYLKTIQRMQHNSA